MANYIPESAYEEIFESRHEVAKLPKGITKYIGLCLSYGGWRIIDLKDGTIYTWESYKKQFGKNPPFPPVEEMIPPYPAYADALFKEAKKMSKSYKKYINKPPRGKPRGFG